MTSKQIWDDWAKTAMSDEKLVQDHYKLELDYLEKNRGILEEIFEKRLLNEAREFSLRSAQRKYKHEFELAYEAARSQPENAFCKMLKKDMQKSEDPGETLIWWYRSMVLLTGTPDEVRKTKQRILRSFRTKRNR